MIVAQWSINITIDNTYCALYHCFISGGVRAGGTKGCLIMFTKLVTHFCKYRFILAWSFNRCFKIITQNGFGYCSVKLQHAVNAVYKICSSLSVYRLTEDQSAVREDGNKHLAVDDLCRIRVYIA